MASIWIWLGVAGLLVYLAFLAYLGYYGSQITLPAVSDYFVAGGSLGSMVVFLTSIGTAFSAITFLGAGGITYDLGINGPVLLGGLFVTDLPALIVVGHKLWKISKIRADVQDYVTPADLLCDRYAESKSLRIFVAIIATVASFFYVAVQFKGVGLVIDILTGGLLSEHQGIALVGIFMAVYIAIGGMRGVAYTDVVQSLLLYAGVIFVSAYILFGQPATLYAQAAQEVDAVTGYTFSPIYLYSVAAGFGLTLPMWPQLWERYYASKRVSGIWSIGFADSLGAVALLTIFAGIVGLAGIAAFPGLEGEQTDTVVLRFINQMPGIVLVFLIPAAVAAAMSTADSIILMIGSVISRDIYQEIVSGDISEERLSTYSKVFSGILTLATVLYAFQKLGEIVQLTLDLAFPAYMLLLPPTVAAFWWKRANLYGTLSSILVAGIYLIYITVQSPLLTNPNLWSGTKAMFVSIIVLILVSLATPQSDDENVDVFTEEIRETTAGSLERSYRESGTGMPTDD